MAEKIDWPRFDAAFADSYSEDVSRLLTQDAATGRTVNLSAVPTV